MQAGWPTNMRGLAVDPLYGLAYLREYRETLSAPCMGRTDIFSTRSICTARKNPLEAEV